MVFKNSISIFLSNISLIYKLLIFMMIVLIVALALFVGIIGPALNKIFSASDVGSLAASYNLENLNNVSYSQVFSTLLSDLRGIFNNNKKVIYNTLLWISLVYLIAKFFFALSNVPIAKVIYDKMSSNFNNGFLAASIQYSKQAVGYALLSSLITAPLDLGVAWGAAALGVWLSGVFNVFAIAISATILLLYAAFRSALFSQWIPLIIVENLGVAEALTRSVAPSLASFKEIFSSALIVYVLIAWASTGGLSLFIFGIVPVFILPFAMVFLGIMNMVKYFNNNNKKYYVDQARIEDPANYI
ncbi:MAG: hypothetical protein ACOYIQ_02585 [Christensenellales bacterium]|jgi:hypothetical protein